MLFTLHEIGTGVLKSFSEVRIPAALHVKRFPGSLERSLDADVVSNGNRFSQSREHTVQERADLLRSRLCIDSILTKVPKP